MYQIYATNHHETSDAVDAQKYKKADVEAFHWKNKQESHLELVKCWAHWCPVGSIQRNAKVHFIWVGKKMLQTNVENRSPRLICKIFVANCTEINVELGLQNTTVDPCSSKSLVANWLRSLVGYFWEIKNMTTSCNKNKKNYKPSWNAEKAPKRPRSDPKRP